MDSRRRILAKALTWQAMGLVTMTLIGLLFTGSVTAGGGIALTGAMTGLVCYLLHEAIWSRVTWGRRHLSALPRTER